MKIIKGETPKSYAINANCECGDNFDNDFNSDFDDKVNNDLNNNNDKNKMFSSFTDYLSNLINEGNEP